MRQRIPAQTIFHDLYLRKRSGNYAQIDLVVPTTAGIVVFEVKDYSGWIFGNGNHSYWTQVLAYGKQKYRFYNPIKQNNSKIQALRKLIGNVPFYSVVVFYGDCVLKEIDFVPAGTFLVKSNRVLEVMKIIIRHNESAQCYNKDEIVRILKEAVLNGENTEIKNRHIRDINDMLGKNRIFE